VFQTCFLLFIITREHALHADRDIVVANPSVCPSVCPVPVLCLNETNEWTYRHNIMTVC